eukprot:TRINITY_DN252_c0_g1_i1.p1 TRINITY_DN252_c0_g1~~TRINITY_DN252_c0_g1_i1.p1  ORF type:complete len:243 (-),score=71.65 TRINITY_DN252_c0_g1_i1:148-876(-)
MGFFKGLIKRHSEQNVHEPVHQPQPIMTVHQTRQRSGSEPQPMTYLQQPQITVIPQSSQFSSPQLKYQPVPVLPYQTASPHYPQPVYSSTTSYPSPSLHAPMYSHYQDKDMKSSGSYSSHPMVARETPGPLPSYQSTPLAPKTVATVVATTTPTTTVEEKRRPLPPPRTVATTAPLTATNTAEEKKRPLPLPRSTKAMGAPLITPGRGAYNCLVTPYRYPFGDFPKDDAETDLKVRRAVEGY